jgi:hypothetical protein
MRIVFDPWAARMKGVGFPSSETIVGASRCELCMPGAGGKTAHVDGALSESPFTWRIKSTGADSV